MDYKEIIAIAVEAGEKALYAHPENNYCGGAYLSGVPGKDPFIKWAKIHDPKLISKGVYKGYDISGAELHSRMKVQYRGQCASRYEAFAEAAAQIFNENGVKCYSKSYLT